MPGERYRHILLPGPSRTQPFTSPRQGGDARQVLDRDRAAHGAYLRQRLDAAWQENDQRQAVAHATRNGVYIDFVGEPGFDLAIRSLERISSGIRLAEPTEVANSSGIIVSTNSPARA